MAYDNSDLIKVHVTLNQLQTLEYMVRDRIHEIKRKHVLSTAEVNERLMLEELQKELSQAGT